MCELASFTAIDESYLNIENNSPVDENHSNPVGETYEDNFMREVENLNPRRQGTPPARFDEDLYIVDNLTADIHEPVSI